jgi:DNA-binding MarR family transcriptional regulator
MSTDIKLDVTKSIGYKLKRTQHALRLCMDNALSSLDLTTPQYSVLAQLEIKPGISNADLARCSFVTAQTMHSILSKLETKNFVKRTKILNNHKNLCAKLTDQGAILVVKAHKIISKVESKMLSTINNKNKLLIEKLLLECFNNLNNVLD